MRMTVERGGLAPAVVEREKWKAIPPPPPPLLPVATIVLPEGGEGELAVKRPKRRAVHLAVEKGGAVREAALCRAEAAAGPKVLPESGAIPAVLHGTKLQVVERRKRSG